MSQEPAIRAIPERLTDERINDAYQHGYWRDELVFEVLARNARTRPDAVAVVEGQTRTTWQELDEYCVRFALGLKRLGLKRGEPVAVQLPNWREYLIAYYGIQLAGGIVVQPGVDWRERETRYALGIGPAAFWVIPDTFGDFDFQAMAATLEGELPALRHTIVARGVARDDRIAFNDLLAEPTDGNETREALAASWPGANEVVRIVFTSGTTGLPKAIMHTNNTIAHSSRTLIEAFDLGASDVLFSYVPLSTNYGVIMGLNLHIDTGGTLVLMDKFSASGALELIDREGVTFFPGTPTAFIALLHSKAMATAQLDSLRMMISAGASFPVQAIKELRATIAAPFVESFGMNEFGMGFWCSLDDDPELVDGAIGRPIPGLEARLAGTSPESEEDQVGELLIKSAGMCAGYFNRPEANAESWDADGWFYSGDLARVDAHGNFRIVGRSKDVIIRGGANVSPREIEELLATHPGVREVSVVGIPDAYYGEIVCACIIPMPSHSLTLDEVRTFLAPNLAAYKLPTRVELVDAFPLNAMGKVVKAKLITEIGS